MQALPPGQSLGLTGGGGAEGLAWLDWKGEGGGWSTKGLQTPYLGLCCPIWLSLEVAIIVMC